jgi:two-component system KDP operon response regulator KdpE
MDNKTILVVDDDPDVRQAMEIRLRANGYDTALAATALSGVAEAIREKPDLIILDLGLPGGDGFVAIERLKQIPVLAMIPIVVVSARDARVNQERALKAGANVFLQKPIENAQLLAIIRQALGEPARPEDAAVPGSWK